MVLLEFGTSVRSPEKSEMQENQGFFFVHTAGVAGSIPAAPTMNSPPSLWMAGFFLSDEGDDR
jgi:hypothetical protein